ncbi:MAG: response regulator [Proteobacteria bacterium]|nr:response regulator [Pseudomonadota bacterium]
MSCNASPGCEQEKTVKSASGRVVLFSLLNGCVLLLVAIAVAGFYNRELPVSGQRGEWYALLVSFLLLVTGVIAGFVWIKRCYLSSQKLLAGRLDGVLANIPVLVAIRNRHGLIVACSNKFRSFFGLSVDDMMVSNSQLYPPDVAAIMNSEIDSVRKEGKHAQFEITFPDLTGRQRTFDLYAFPLNRSVDGIVEEVGSFAVELTELRITEAAMRQALEDAETANRAKSEFLSRMSHELRNPMNAIIGFTQLLEDDRNNPLSDDQQDSLHEISKAGHHLLTLINEVLDLARIESGRLSLSLEALEPRELCLECISLLRPLAEKHGITVTLAPGTPARVKADRIRLRQVLINLVSNGIKYNRDGGKVEVGCDLEPDSFLRIWVRDTGHGIEPEFLPSLFQPFERAATVDGLIEGTGIGLVLSKRLTEAMGGTIGFETSLGCGSLFWVELVQAEQMEEMEMSPDAPTAPLPVSSERTRRVLYVEDNLANMRLVKKIISGLGGIELLTAESAEAGLELVRIGRPHLILMDINLPGMDGFEALGLLRQNPETRAIPVIAVTASVMADQVHRLKEAGFDDYLAKPINLQHFVAAVDALLDKNASEDTK